MIDQIKASLKAGKLLEAAEQLDQLVRTHPDADPELKTDAAVLLQNISTLERQAKRRRVKGAELEDSRTAFSYDLLDLLEKAPQTASGAAQQLDPLGVTAATGNPAAPVVPPTSGPVIINYGTMGNVDIDITNNIKTEINHFYGAAQELKSELQQHADDPAVAEMLADVEEVEQAAQEVEKAETKEEAAEKVSKIKRFFDKLNDRNTNVGKVLDTVRSSAKLLGRMAGYYNGVAQWVGMPQVPTLLVKLFKGKEE